MRSTVLAIISRGARHPAWTAATTTLADSRIGNSLPVEPQKFSPIVTGHR
jgi:hypothetical protein